MSEWKKEIGRRLDQIVLQVSPDVRKAIRLNTPLFGREDGWFFSMYCYERYVKLTFFSGSDLVPPPPDTSKVEGVRYFKIREGEEWDDALVSDWLLQSSNLSGVKLW